MRLKKNVRSRASILRGLVCTSSADPEVRQHRGQSAEPTGTWEGRWQQRTVLAQLSCVPPRCSDDEREQPQKKNAVVTCQIGIFSIFSTKPVENFKTWEKRPTHRQITFFFILRQGRTGPTLRALQYKNVTDNTSYTTQTAPLQHR